MKTFSILLASAVMIVGLAGCASSLLSPKEIMSEGTVTMSREFPYDSGLNQQWVSYDGRLYLCQENSFGVYKCHNLGKNAPEAE